MTCGRKRFSVSMTDPFTDSSLDGSCSPEDHSARVFVLR
jgi:hypothetical protein